jgi:capsular exopolysaccharide synthesis family protein
MNKFSIDNVNNTENTEEIDLREIIFKYLRYWRWFVLSVIIFLMLGSIVYLRMDREFSISTSVLLKENQGSGPQKSSPLGSLEELGLLSTTNNIDNEIAVFSSPNLMKQIVLALELQTTYFESGIFRDTEIYKNCPYYVKLEDIKPDDLKGYIELSINNLGEEGIAIEGKYIIKKEEVSIEGKLDKLPGFINLPSELGRLYITQRAEANNEKLDETYYVQIDNAQRVAYDLAKQIQVDPTTKKSSVLAISLDVLNVSKGIDILNEVVKTYNRNNVQENNEMAINTSNFINERLDSISIELSGIEDKVVNFKKEQGITDLSTEAKVFVEQTATVEQKRIETETQLKTVELIENFIHKPNNDYKLIPTLGITDIGLAEVITQYNESLLAYQRLERSASENNPSRERALAELMSTRQSIQAAINNVKNALRISKSESEKQANQISSRIKSVPTQERGLLEVTRQQQIKQALYLYLMQVREETSITMASTSDKAKVITDPIVPDYPVSPKKNVIFLIAFLIGIIVPIVVIYVKDLLQLNITGREELEKLSNITVIGEIMKKEDGGTIVVRDNRTTPIVELFRTLRNNVKFVLDEPDKKIILVTSTVPGEGKTFVSINLAASFALSEKKILLIGMDIRNPRLAADMNFAKSTGLTSYLSGSVQDWKTMLHQVDNFPNLDILQAGAIPPNPNELLMKPLLKKLIDEARALYDIIVIDSAPIGVVSDTFLVSSFANTTVYVTRENVTPKNAIAFVNEVHRDNKLPNMYLVINGVEMTKNKGRHGRYGYGYTYGYGNREEK